MLGDPLEALRGVNPEGFLGGNDSGRCAPERFNEVLVHQQVVV
jgi:hypothetical protein